MAMARPRRPEREGELVTRSCAEIGARGSNRNRAQRLARSVARLAITHLRATDCDPIRQIEIAGAKLTTPALAELAMSADIDIAGTVARCAVQQFEAGNYRYVRQEGEAASEAKLEMAVANALAERFRRYLRN